MRSLFVIATFAAIAGCHPPPIESGGAATEEQEVRIPTSDGRVPFLAGSLHAASTGKGPAVLMIQGSGPTDRDWNNPHIPGENGSGGLVAHALARAGLTVLAYDKRGTGRTAKDPAPGPTTADDDARSALRFLLARGHRVGLFGHSDGASIARRVALTEPRVAAVVLAAAPGRSLRTLLREQITRNILRPAGVSSRRTIEANLRWIEKVVRSARGSPLPAAPRGAHPRVRELARTLKRSPRLGAMARRFDEEPTRELARLEAPVLILGGGRDVQVARADYDALVRAARAGQGVWIPDMDHVLKLEVRPPTRLSEREVLARYGEPRPVHPRLLAAVCRFLRKQLAADRDPAVRCPE
jgi:hypothetical protein